MRTALLVRGYNPTASMLRRWEQFARSCRVDTSPPILFSVSLDVTNRSRTYDLGRLKPIRVLGALAHTYDEPLLLRSFPGLKVLARKYEELTGKRYRIGRYAIIEPILLWHEWISHKGGHRIQHYWVVEQDVACTSPEHIASKLLATYDDDPRDLLTALPMNESRLALKFRTQGSTGFHAAVHTPSFALAFPKPEEQLRTASIFVQRWSAALAEALHESMKTKHMHAWAEIATPSLCKRANLTIGALRAKHRGALFHACCTRHVKTTARNFLPDEKKFAMRLNQSEVRLYHPVKF